MGISIALCTCNGERYLRQQLESIAAQTLLPDEIVACDDASDDRTVSILEGFAKTSSVPIRIHRNTQRLGVSENFRKAIGLCSCELIALSDQDDVWLPEKLEKQAARFRSQRCENVQVLFSDLELVDERLRSLGKTMWQHLGFTPALRRRWKNGGATDVLIRYGNVVTGSTIMLRSTFRDQADAFIRIATRVWIHDGKIALAAAFRNTIDFLAEPTVLYRQHSGQLIGGAELVNASETSRLKKFLTGSLNVTRELRSRLHYLKQHRLDLLDLGLDASRLSVLDPVIEHIKTRLSLPPGRWRRLPRILGEWIRLRYWKYSGSLALQALRDWAVKHNASLV